MLFSHRFGSVETLARAEKQGDLFEPVLKLKQKLPKLEALEGLSRLVAA